MCNSVIVAVSTIAMIWYNIVYSTFAVKSRLERFFLKVSDSFCYQTHFSQLSFYSIDLPKLHLTPFFHIIVNLKGTLCNLSGCKHTKGWHLLINILLKSYVTLYKFKLMWYVLVRYVLSRGVSLPRNSPLVENTSNQPHFVFKRVLIFLFNVN